MPTTPSTILLTPLMALLAGSVFAQDATDPDSADKHQKIQIIDPTTLPPMGTDQTPIEPTTPSISTPHQTGLTQGQDWMQVVNNSIGTVSTPITLAEGSFILSRTGRLVPAPNDRLIFVPTPEQRLAGEAPVLLLPNAALERLENIWANQPVTISGEIFTYHRRNHLLLSDFTLAPPNLQPNPTPIPESTEPVETEPAETSSTQEPNPQPTLDEDPDVLDLLRELDAETAAPSGSQLNPQSIGPIQQRSNQHSSQLQTAPPILAPGLREGTLLIRRPARLDRSSDGAWMAIFDNDDKSAPNGIELTILPCALLMTMENQAIDFGDSARFVVSGRLYIHNNRGYLLPTFYQRLRTSNIKPWQ